MVRNILGTAAFIAAMAWGLYGAYALRVQTGPMPSGWTEDCAAKYDARYGRLRPWLPTSGVIGFAGRADIPPGQPPWCNTGYLAQYALAPLIVSPIEESAERGVARNSDPRVPLMPAIVVVELQTEPGRRFPNDHPEYHLVEDLGDGLLLMATPEGDRLLGRAAPSP